MTTQTGSESTSSGAFAFPESGDAEIFLTPKVIDQGAFTKYSESLQALIREVSSSGGSLKSLSAETKSLQQDASEITVQLRTRIEATGKLLPALDQRVRAATEVLAHAAKSAALPETLRGELDAIIAERVSEVERRAESAVTQAEERLKAIEARSNEATSRVSAQADRLEAAVDRASEALAKTEAKQSTLTGELAKVPESVDGFIKGRLDALHNTLGERERQINEQASELDERVAEILESVDARVGSMIDTLDHEFGTREQKLSACVRTADEQAAEIVNGLDTFIQQTKGLPAELTEDLGVRVAELRAHLEGVEGRASALRELSVRAVELLGFDPAMGEDAPIRSDSLMALVQNAMEIERSIRDAVEQGGAMCNAVRGSAFGSGSGSGDPTETRHQASEETQAMPGGEGVLRFESGNPRVVETPAEAPVEGSGVEQVDGNRPGDPFRRVS